MLIAIEGVDKTGKTTLAARLANDYLAGSAEVRHASAPKAHPVEAYEGSLRRYDPRGKKSLILDRFHLGEHVWPSIFERQTLLTKGVARHVELFLRSRGTWTVYAERSLDDVEHDVRDAVPPEPIRPDQVRAAMNLFELALAFSGDGRCSRWNYDEDGDDTLEAVIANAQAEVNRVSPMWEITSEWLGDPEPTVLLVGDEFGTPQSGGPVDLVPFCPLPNSCGLYLMEALPDWWRSCAVLNAREGRGDGKIRPLWWAWEVLNEPKVIALGQRASEALDFCEVPHETVPHPQYWKRFHYRFPEEYTRQLREASQL